MQRSPPVSFLRNASVQLPLVAIPEVRWNGFRLRPNDGVEFLDKRGQTSLFLKICLIIKDLSSDEVVLRGHVYRRHQAFGSMLSWKVNELCAELEVEEDDTRSIWAQAMIDLPLERVLKKRRIEVTELDFPHKSWRNYTTVDSRKAGGREVLRSIAESDRLTCRYVYVTFYRNIQGRSRKRHQRDLLRRITTDDLVEIVALSNTTTPLPVRSQSYSNRKTRHRSRSASLELLSNSPEGRITYADICCCAGGSLRGAMMAGVRPVWAIDIDPDACASARLNAPCPVFQYSICDFARSNLCTHADVVHISFPCKPYSPAHWRAAQYARDLKHFLLTGEHIERAERDEAAEERDEQNRLVLWSLQPLLKKIRPRIVTMEQTSGMLEGEGNRLFFDMMISQFIDAGYDPMWGIEDFSEQESVEKRNRLIIIASA